MSHKRKSVNGYDSDPKKPRLDDGPGNRISPRYNCEQDAHQNLYRSNGQYNQNHNRSSSYDFPLSRSHNNPLTASSPNPASKEQIPTLPAISPEYQTPVFTHPSLGGQGHLQLETYDRLEFLGDAYIELIASRLIWSQYQDLPTGRMSQLRELLVKNETLSQFSIMYGFDKRLNAVPNLFTNLQMNATRAQKINGDIFEAYVAAVILSDPIHGYQKAEEWLKELWKPILNGLDNIPSNGNGSVSIPPASSIESINSTTNGNHEVVLQQTPTPQTTTITTPTPTSHPNPTHPSPNPNLNPSLNPLRTPDPKSKESLAKILLCPSSKLEYLETQPPEFHHGRGLETFYVGVFFSGYEGKYQRVKLGQGSGQSKNTAGQMAATNTMEDQAFQGVLEELKEEKRIWVERKRVEKEKMKMMEEGGNKVAYG